MPEKIIRYENIQDYTGLSAARVKNLVVEGRFPKPFKLHPGGRALGWLESTIEKYQKEVSGQSSDDGED